MIIPDEMVNHHDYEIDLRDIWQYEREAFLKQEISSEYADYLKYKIRNLIIDKDPKRGHKKGQPNEYTYSKYYKRFNEKKGLIEKEFMLDFFVENEILYFYDKSLIIKRETSNYEYWFALKLRQYDSKLVEIPEFLTYQLEKKYSKNKPAFTDFLDLLLLQYNDKQMISERVIKRVQKWIANPIISKPEQSNISSPPSFTLLKIQTNPNYLKESTLHFIDILKELKDADFIDKKCNPEHFVAIFSGNKINKAHRVNWTSTIKQLYFFINLLMDLQKIRKFKFGKWHTTVKCFIVDDKEITALQVGRPDGKTPSDKRLRSIVEKIK